MKLRSLALAFTFLSTAAAPVVWWNLPADPPSAESLTGAAQTFLAALDEAQHKMATFEFEAAERENWQFVPNIYPGITLAKLTVAQRRTVHQLLATTLSSTGYHKTTTIMQLEDVLRNLAEDSGQKAPHRDPGRYSVAVFGQPGPRPWGYRLQGHHVSLNVSVVDGKIAATTPTFLGANPGEIRHGTFAGLRALPDEEDLGFELLLSLTAEQRKTAVIHDHAPSDVLFGPGRKKEVLGEPKGLFAKDMTDPQQATLQRLLDTYLGNLRTEIATYHRRRIEAAGIDKISFVWMGAQLRGTGHYYRLHGPTFVVEYDNTQNGANHVHTVFHDLSNDFGADLLDRHYRNHHGK